MKTLLVIRHGKSSWENPGLSDTERPLLQKGVKRTKKVAEYLLTKAIIPDKIVSSPAKRANQTAEIIAEHLSYDPKKIDIDASFYFKGSDAIYEAVEEFDNTWQTVFIFGHNPDFNAFANQFLMERLYHLPTTGVVLLKFETSDWKTVNVKNCISQDIIIPRNL